MGRFEGVPQRDLAQRKVLFEAVKKLKADGLSYNEIIARVGKEHGARLSKSHVSGWLTGAHLPDGSVRKFEPTPTFELGYVTGTTLGDGTTSISGDHNYRIKLQVSDDEFAEEFARCLGVVLNRSPPNVRWFPARRMWRTEVSSRLLQEFLRGPIEDIEATIASTKECKTGFLRGFFDSEGSASKYQLSCANGELSKQSLVVKLLNSLRIVTTGPRLGQRKGGTKIIRGKECQINKDSYIVTVRAESRNLFESIIGFTIQRKIAGLAEGRNVVHKRLRNSQL
ncbi:MAG: hypothetical protein OK456_07055 [Thaumarchaeota archaeon]|nr:hypothetical protein [Nitrososphaerota archaeon]